MSDVHSLLGPGNRWFYVKLINHAGGHVKVSPDQILPATTLDVDESQVEYARLEPGDEYKRIVLRAVDVKNDEPPKLNGEFTLALRPDDAGDVARVKITRGGKWKGRQSGRVGGWGDKKRISNYCIL